MELTEAVKCSNYIGAALELAVQYGFQKILLLGHIGKLSKLGAGIMNTHSAEADGRLEVLLRCALRAGASLELLQQIDGCVTTDGALQLLQQAGLLEPAMAVLLQQMENYLQKKNSCCGAARIDLFTNQELLPAILCQSSGAEQLLPLWQRK